MKSKDGSEKMKNTPFPSYNLGGYFGGNIAIFLIFDSFLD